MTNIERVWGSIKRNPGCGLVDIVRRTKLPYGAVKVILYRMNKMGQARWEGAQKFAKWHALGERPSEGRGAHVNSLANLDQDPTRRMERLYHANLARGVDVRPTRRAITYDPNQLCELQKCMMGYKSRTEDKETA